MRDDKWLLSRLDYIWSNYFEEVEQTNQIFIRFGRLTKFRLGSIKMDKTNKKTFITISGLFKNESIPQEVVDQTIAHELTHYTHGFSSLRPKLHKYPHEGGVVNKELKRRGLNHLVTAYKKWMKGYRRHIRSQY